MDRGNQAQGENSDFLKILHKGQPKVLGAIQISLVLFYIAMGVISKDMTYISSFTIQAFFVYWGIPFYIIAGSISVAVGKKSNPNIPLVRAFLSMNILSSLESFGALILLCIDMYWAVTNGDTILPIIFSFLIIANVLQFSVSVTLSTFGRQALSVKPSHQVTTTPTQYNNPMLRSRSTPAPPQYNNPMVTSHSIPEVGNINPYFKQEDNGRPKAYLLPQMSTFQYGLQRAPTFSQPNYQDNYRPPANNERRFCSACGSQINHM